MDAEDQKPQKPEPPKPPERHIQSGDILGAFILGIVFLVVVPVGVLNMLAAKNLWNPLKIEGRVWSGLLMIAAPLSMLLITGLPYRIRKKIPDSVGCLVVIAVWAALFLA